MNQRARGLFRHHSDNPPKFKNFLRRGPGGILRTRFLVGIGFSPSFTSGHVTEILLPIQFLQIWNRQLFLVDVRTDLRSPLKKFRRVESRT